MIGANSLNNVSRQNQAGIAESTLPLPSVSRWLHACTYAGVPPTHRGETTKTSLWQIFSCMKRMMNGKVRKNAGGKPIFQIEESIVKSPLRLVWGLKWIKLSFVWERSWILALGSALSLSRDSRTTSSLRLDMMGISLRVISLCSASPVNGSLCFTDGISYTDIYSHYNSRIQDDEL